MPLSFVLIWQAISLLLALPPINNFLSLDRKVSWVPVSESQSNFLVDIIFVSSCLEHDFLRLHAYFPNVLGETYGIEKRIYGKSTSVWVLWEKVVWMGKSLDFSGPHFLNHKTWTGWSSKSCKLKTCQQSPGRLCKQLKQRLWETGKCMPQPKDIVAAGALVTAVGKPLSDNLIFQEWSGI